MFTYHIRINTTKILFWIYIFCFKMFDFIKLTKTVIFKYCPRIFNEFFPFWIKNIRLRSSGIYIFLAVWYLVENFFFNSSFVCFLTLHNNVFTILIDLGISIFFLSLSSCILYIVRVVPRRRFRVFFSRNFKRLTKLFLK